jgi:hypothetical protein
MSEIKTPHMSQELLGAARELAADAKTDDERLLLRGMLKEESGADNVTVPIEVRDGQGKIIGRTTVQAEVQLTSKEITLDPKDTYAQTWRTEDK